MSFKKKLLTVVTGAALITSSISTFNADVANAELNKVRKYKPSISQHLSPLALSSKSVQELVIVNDGKTDITPQLKSLGVKVTKNVKNYAYLASVPTSKVMQVYKIKGVSALTENKEVKLQEKNDTDFNVLHKKSPSEVVGPATIETHDSTGVDQFQKLYDGTGTRIAIIDSGIDPGHEAFTTTTSGTPKIVAQRDLTVGNQSNVHQTLLAEGDVVFGDAIPSADSITVGGKTYNTATLKDTADDFYFGMFAPDPGASDLNADDSSGDDKFGVLMVNDKVYIDTDADKDFTDEKAHGNNSVDNFDVNKEDDKIGANFYVNSLDTDEPFVNIFYDGNGHGTHVAGIAAANGPSRDNGNGAVAMKGVAPGAELVGLKVFRSEGGAATISIMEGMILAALPESEGGFNADVANMSLGSSPDLNDGNNAYNELLNILTDEFGIIYSISAGNDGPGTDTLGAPGDSERSISVGAHINSKMWATEYGAYPYGKDKDGNPIDGEGLWYFSASGPREDGMQKPDIVAPGASYASYPVHLEDQSGYAVLQGTSMSAPYVAGVLADLVNATKKNRLQFDDKIAREALIQTANPLSGYNKARQGAGLIDVNKAYDYISSNFITEIKEVDASVYYGEKVSGGKGLYVRNKEIPSQVEVGLSNPSKETKNLTLKGSADWFNPSVNSVSLAPGESKTIKVSYDKSKLKSGVNAETLVVDDARTPYVEARIPQTIVIGEEFNEANHFRKSFDGEVQASQDKSHYVKVEQGMDELRLSLSALMKDGEYQGRVRMLVFDPDGKQVNDFIGYAGYGAGGLNVEDHVVKNPKPGVWEVAIYATFAPEEGKEVNAYKLDAVVQDVIKKPGKIELGKVSGDTKMEKSVSFRNYTSDERKVKIEAGAFSAPTSNVKRVDVPLESYYLHELNLKNNVSLTVKTNNPVNAGDDVDLEFYRLVEGKLELVGSSGTSTSDEEVSFRNLPDGKYYAAVFGYATETGQATKVDLTIQEAKVLDPGEKGEGLIKVSDDEYSFPVGKELSSTVEITTPKAAGTYTAGLFLKDARTNEVLSILPISIDGNLVNQIAGENRVDTAIQVSKALLPNGFSADHANKTVILTTATNFPDALSAGPLSSELEAPILLTESTKLTDAVKNEIKRLKAENVIILGGAVSVPASIEKDLEALGLDKDNISRIAGEGRYDTNLEIVNELKTHGYEGNGVFLATGENFADALSAASVAGQKKMPIVLTDGKTLSDEAKELLKDEDVYVLGGTTVVSESVAKEVGKVASDVTRLSGADRYGTLAAIQKMFAPASSELFVASGETFPDALASAPLITGKTGTLVLVRPNDVPKDVDAFLTKYSYTNDIKNVTVLGGLKAVGQDVRDAIEEKVRK